MKLGASNNRGGGIAVNEASRQIAAGISRLRRHRQGIDAPTSKVHVDETETLARNPGSVGELTSKKAGRGGSPRAQPARWRAAYPRHSAD